MRKLIPAAILAALMVLAGVLVYAGGGSSKELCPDRGQPGDNPPPGWVKPCSQN